MQEQSAGKPGNFVLFMILTFAVIMLHSWYVKQRQPQPQPGKPVADAKAEPGKQDKQPADKPQADTPEGEKAEPQPDQEEPKPKEDEKPSPDEDEDHEPADEPAADERPLPAVVEPQKWYTIGSADPADPYRMLVTLTDRGAAVARIELNSPRYPALMDDDGDLGREGYLASTGGYLGRVTMDRKRQGKGCLVQVVGRGTPAQKAGLRPGDLITKVNGKEVNGAEQVHRILAKRRPGRQVELIVVRDGKELPEPLTVALTRPPMEVVHPENDDPLSFLLTLSKIDKRKLRDAEIDEDQSKDTRPVYVEEELPGLKLRKGTWEVADQADDRIEFRCKLPRWGLEVVKTFRLEPIPTDKQADADYPAYHLVLDVKVQLLEGATKARRVAYQLDGPTGLPIEGWWFANKVGRSWGAGLRDVIASFNHRTPGMVGCITIADDKVQDFVWHGAPDQSLTYVGVDAQYFSAVLIPRKSEENRDEIWFASGEPLRVGKVDPKRKNLTDVTCRIRSVTAKLTPGGKPLAHSFTIFAGPKRPEILAHYGLQELIYYGWPIYAMTARPMVTVLHFFHRIVGNYGVAILLLTVLVRLLLYPMSRKQVLGAQKMAELQPEIKKIQEKYKKDMEARTRAQQELFKKHNYNPLSGCLVMFVQLPIFIGLYRGLMIDVELRGSPLLWSGLRWCSNLSAPDMLFDWSPLMHWLERNFTVLGLGPFINNMLGPYFNLLPVLTIVLFLWQQKMFMPPPTDEQQRMQQGVMKYMMVFMGLLFFKVASGLCVYFIASSAWGLAERKLMPKTPKKDDSGGNGGARQLKHNKPRR